VPHYLRAARRHAWLVAAALVAVVLSAGALLLLQQPVYRASMKIVVGQAGGVFQPDASGSVDSFTRTMTNLLQSQVVAERVIARSRVDATPDELLAGIGVSAEPQSSVLTVTYDSTDRREAATVLGAVGSVFAELVGERLGAGTDRRASAPVTATVFDPAHVDSEPVAPRPARTLAVAILLGLLVGAGLVALREALNQRIYGVGEAEEALDAKVVGTLPRQLRGRTPYLQGRGANGDGAAALDVLGANVRFGPIGRAKVVVVTSARPGDGRSTVAACLGVALGLGDDVICVDADGRTPGLAGYLGVQAPEVGLRDILVGRAGLDEALLDVQHAVVGIPEDGGAARQLSAGWTTPAPIAPVRHGIGCRLLAHGRSEQSPAPVATSDATARLMTALRHAARYAIIDAPPLLDSAGGFALAASADAVIVVARDGVTTLADATAVAAILERLPDRTYGVVLTDSRDSVAELWPVVPGPWTEL
jgi:succinoglycan biosynthesis transport protein ExoP